MFSYSEDMLPRHLPNIHRMKSLQPFDEAIPQPTLPGVSLICSSEISAKSQPSLRQWNNRKYRETVQYDSTKHQAKLVTKHVRFVANNGNDVRTKLECSFSESQKKHQQPRRIKLEVADNIKLTSFESRCSTSELTKEKCLPRFSLSPSDHQYQSHRNDFSKIAHLHAENFVIGSRQMLSGDCGQSHSSYEVLLNILEEQQRHISMQRDQILAQEKQNLEQQKEICSLEYQIQQLLLQQEAVVLQSYEPPISAWKTKRKFAGEATMDFGCSITEFPEDVSIDEKAKDFEITQVTGEAVSSEQFMFDDELGTAAASSVICHDKSSGAASSYRHSSICASSSYGQSQLAMDRSLVLNMLTLKYKCSGRDAQKPSAEDNRFADDDDDVPSDVYDYLVRHGLIRQRICNGRNDRFH